MLLVKLWFCYNLAIRRNSLQAIMNTLHIWANFIIDEKSK